jgi:formyl-CoA transferase
MLQEIAHPGLSSGKVRFAGFAAKLVDTPATVRRHPPMRGEHTHEILGELGFSAHEVQALIDAGVARALRTGD